MALRGLPREKVLATVVRLLETTLIRVGNDEYAKQNKSYGLTTLRDRHVKVDGAELRFEFKGKSGKTWNLQVKDRRIARIVQGLPGPAGPGAVPVRRRGRRAARRDLGRRQRLPARDHRRRHHRQGFPHLGRHRARGPGAAGVRELRHARPRRRRTCARRSSASPSRLGNTPTICRKCYIHPEVLNCYLDGSPAARHQGGGRGRAARGPRRHEAGGGGGAFAARGPDRPRAGEDRRRGAGAAVAARAKAPPIEARAQRPLPPAGRAACRRQAERACGAYPPSLLFLKCAARPRRFASVLRRERGGARLRLPQRPKSSECACAG